MEIQFCGAAKSVTGSQHLLTIGGKKLLLDCGLFQGRRQETFDRNKTLPFDPNSIDAMILSHAHIDHSGNIPNLVRNGFRKTIFCTKPSVDLCTVMLQDSAHIQEKDAEYMNYRQRKKNLPPREPIYTVADAQASLKNFVGLDYGVGFEPIPNVKATFYNAGHMFGSAMLLLEITENGKRFRFGFTGDLGRKNLPIINDPDQITGLDIFISESTYGNKLHDPVKEIQGDLVKVITETVNKHGKIVIPAFSVERTQEIVYHLNKLHDQQLIPTMPVFVDSPLAVNVTTVFEKYPDYYDAEAQYLLSRTDNPFAFSGLKYITKADDSKKLNTFKEPCIIISASGMCEAGRILHHLRYNIENPNNTILIVGFMAEHTLGRKLVDKEEKIKIFGDEYELRANVVKLNSFSGHADKNDLMNFAVQVGTQADVFLVHGEEPQSQPFATALRSAGFKDVTVPERLEKFKV